MSACSMVKLWSWREKTVNQACNLTKITQKWGNKSYGLTQSEIVYISWSAWLVMCNEQALILKQLLLLDKTGVPHFNFLHMAWQVWIKNNDDTMGIFHQSRPASLKSRNAKEKECGWKHLVLFDRNYATQLQIITGFTLLQATVFQLLNMQPISLSKV